MWALHQSPGRDGDVRRMNRYALVTLIAFIVIILDQISKAIIIHTINLHESIPVIDGFFNLVHIRNRGIAFGLLNASNHSLGFYIQVPAVILAVLVIVWWLHNSSDKDRHLLFGLALIIGGAIGNLIDRIRYREVIDFLDFHIGSYAWPAFNLADSAVTIGAIYLGIMLVFFNKQKDKDN